MRRTIVIVIGIALVSGCATPHFPKKQHDRALRFQRHQHLMVAAIREIVNEDVAKDCQYLSYDECSDLKKDQQSMVVIMHEASKSFDSEGF